jgi:hypothetical protein
MSRGASLEGHLNVTPGGPLRVNDGEGFALGMIETLTGKACDATNRGAEVTLRGVSGIDDATYKCTYDGTSAYAWRQVAHLPADPGADRICFWDDSAGELAYLTPDATDLVISGTTLALGSAPSFTDFTNANHDHGDADDGGSLAASITLTTPTIADFTNAQHDHLDADDGGTLTINALSDVGGITAILTGTNTWDIGNTANGGVVSRTVTVTGAVTGDPCCAGLTTLPVNWEINCQVSSTDTATVIAINRTGGNSDPASGTVRATVFTYS